MNKQNIVYSYNIWQLKKTGNMALQKILENIKRNKLVIAHEFTYVKYPE